MGRESSPGAKRIPTIPAWFSRPGIQHPNALVLASKNIWVVHNMHVLPYANGLMVQSDQLSISLHSAGQWTDAIPNPFLSSQTHTHTLQISSQTAKICYHSNGKIRTQEKQKSFE